jgi:diguanylate cyclase (GGDEF)-like protein
VHEDVDLEPALRAAEDTAVALGSATVAMVDGVWALACPIAEPGATEAHGMIVLARRSNAFADEERDLLRHLCEQAGVAAGNSQRHETLHRQALTDELTGLANHRRLQELLGQGAERYVAAGAPLALILFDLDNFKVVNDTRGHQTGDRVLRAVSDTLRDCCRAGDEPARYGGEELAIVVQGASFEEVLALAERARASVAALELVDMEGADLRVSTSVGVAELGPGMETVEALIASADAALYRAKHAGKNCVRFGPAADDSSSLVSLQEH